MSSLATSCKAINLSQGYPDFGVDEKLIKLVKKYLDLGFDQYAPMQGVLKLREAVSEKYYNLYGRYYHENDEITITTGATQAIFTSIK